MTPLPIRVASVPARHVYVRHLGLEGDGITRLATSADTYCSSQMVNGEWPLDNAQDFDVFHVHFNLDGVSLQDLGSFVRVLRRLGKPLVFTAHDLVNVRTLDQELHWAQLEILVAEADELVTLTDTAARRIEDTFGRTAIVVPHPHVVPLGVISRASERLYASQLSTFRVGLHLKSLRPGIAASTVLAYLLRLLPDCPWLELLVDVHTDALINLPEAEAALPDLLEDASERPRCSVYQHPRYTDNELWRYLMSIDLSILPYRLGTHSGWAEACLDVGTHVAAPIHTCITSQHPSIIGYDITDLGSLRLALEAAVRIESFRPWTAVSRLRQRVTISETHLALYRRLLET